MMVARNLTKRFGKLTALDDVSIHLQQGECIALMGPNGSGKTTLIKCMLGMVVPDCGFISFNDKDISHDWEYRQRIGYMPQIGRYPDNMTIGQVISMIKDLRGSYNRNFDEELIESFGLNRIVNKRMRTLSGGTRQKVSASLAFLVDADMLILDEPTAGLDPVASELLSEKIRVEMKKGKLIVISSHILSELDDLVTEAIYMQEGKLLFHKNIHALRAETGQQKLSRAIASVMLNQ
jgi:Cu-processing system ATP-binding protein